MATDIVQVTSQWLSVSATSETSIREGFTILPRSRAYRTWESFSVFLCYATCLLVPFQASFDSSKTSLWVFAYLLDVFFLLDVVLHFFLPYYERASLVTDRTLIQRKYIKGRFLLDLLTLLPIDLLMFAIQGDMRWHQALSLVRLNRMLRIHRLIKFFDNREEDLRSNKALIRTVKYTAMATLLVHFFACGWYSLACNNVGAADSSCIKESWAELQTGIAKGSLWKKYMMSFYWAAATTTSTGYGDVHAVTVREKWFSVVAMLVGIAAFFGLILGSMTSMLTNLDTMRAHYTHHLNAIKEHLKDLDITETVQHRVLTYYEYMWSTAQGVSTFGIFDDLPITFQAELAHTVNRKILDKAKVFKDMTAGFKRMLSMCIKPMLYMPNQAIIHKGETVHKMFYIHKGKAEVMGDDGETATVTLNEGYIFGEVSLVYNLLRTCTVRAVTPCVIFFLDRSDVNNILKYYPEASQILCDAVDDRCQIVERTREGSVVLDLEPEQANQWLVDQMRQSKDRDRTISIWHRLSNYVIMPDSKLLAIWERVHLVALIVVCFLYPFVASFSVALHSLGYGENVSMTLVLVFTYILDGILFADFLMRFNLATPYTTDLKEIRHAYVRTILFWVDLIAVLPIEIFAGIGPSRHGRWHTLGFLKLNRVLKIFRIWAYFGELENRFDSSIAKVRSLKFAVYIALSTHLCACLWFFETCYGHGGGCAPDSWAVHIMQVQGSVGPKEYFASMYWAAATMSSTGYGDIHPHDEESQFISVIVMFVGMLLYGYCLGSFSAAIATSAAPRSKFQGRIRAVRDFMATHDLVPTLIERVEDYLVVLWKIHKGEVIPGSKRLMEDMPIVLQQDVCAEESIPLIEKVPIFFEIPEDFLRVLSLETTTYLFKPGDYVVYAGDMGREMYCIRRGMVNVMIGYVVVATLGPGSFFGEIGLLFGESRFATVQAKTYCEIVMLTKQGLDKALKDFPIIKRDIIEAGAKQASHWNALQTTFQSSRNEFRRLSLECAQKAQSSREAYKAKQQETLLAAKNMGDITEEETDEIDLDMLQRDSVLEQEFKKPYQAMSLVGRAFSYLLMRRGISPEQLWFKIWQGVTTAAAGTYITTLGLQAAVLHVDPTFWVLNYVFDVLFLIDIYIKFHVGFYNKNNVLVTHPVYTARNYLRTNFALDVLSCFPTEIFVLASLPVNIGILKIMAFARLNRCIHFYRLIQFFTFMEEPLGNLANIFRQLKFVIYMAIFTHYMACGWFILACDGQDDGSHICREGYWAMSSDHSLKKDDSVIKRYLISFYWASATCASVGYGDIHSFNMYEMIYSLVFIIFGVVFYSYIVASVAAGLANADAQRARYQERLTSMKDFLEDANVASNLQNKIISHYEYMWLRNRGVDQTSLFQGIPLALHADITTNLYRESIEKVPLFQGTEIGFLKMLSMYVKPIYFLAKEYILRKGDIGKEMYFIHKGEVEIISDDDEPIVYATLGAGRFIGEMSVLFNTQTTASVRTKTNCDVYALTKEDLSEVLSHYPEIKEMMLHRAEENRLVVNERQTKMSDAKEKELESEDDAQNKIEIVDDGDDNANAPNWCKTCFLYLWDLLSQFVIEPESKLRYITFFNCLLICFTTLTITYMAAFQEHAWYLYLFTYLCEVSFYVEIFFNFNMAYRLPTGELETDQRSIALHYVKGKFPLDLLASFPIDIFALAAPAEEQMEVLSFLRLLHLIRIVRLQQFFTEYGYKLNIDVFKVRMSKFFIEVVLVVHMFACGWYFIDCRGNTCHSGHTWLDDHDLRGKPGLEIYASSLYWVVGSVTTTGYGDIHADNEDEMVYASFVMVTGKLLFGFILGNIASTLSNLEMKQLNYVQKLNSIKTHLKEQKIADALQQRVLNFYEFIWGKNKGVKYESLFFDIPHCLGGELAIELVGHVLEKMPLFEDAPTSFIRLLSTKVKSCQFHAKEYILRKGDIGQEMYIIKKGLAEVVIDDQEVIRVLEEDSLFGETYLLLPGIRSESVRAVTNVDTFTISKDDFDEVLVIFEDMKTRVNDAITELKEGRRMPVSH